MNRFRTKKKVKETSEPSARPSTDSETPYMPNTLKPSKTFKLGRKNTEAEQEPKLEIDLSSALPSSDDFRTSLLMSGLSARFSMLREQDDPKSKLGKASDDSVLFPKRQSRLMDFGFQANSLADIAEVSSINGSIRPPLTAVSRADSDKLNEGTGTDNDSEHTGSIMNRGKPGEGNNLFGGRQKIYMGNRTLYENDVSQSAFQKMRREEREKERRREQEAQMSRSESPPLSDYNRNRETSSTTSSTGPSTAHISTAATSFTSLPTSTLGSQTPITANAPASGLERSVTKTRRLYETGLDNHLHEQQFSAMSRVDTLTKRSMGLHTPPPGMSPTFTPSTLDKWNAQALAKQSMPNLRAASPPPTGSTLKNLDFGSKTQNTDVDSKAFGLTDPPLSPPVSEHDEVPVLASSGQPNDKGKTTAIGAFSKTTQQYDDNKYSQRQIQMQQGRETPPLRKHSPPSAFAPRQQQTGRNRAESYSTYGSGRSRSSSSVQGTYMPEPIPEAPKPLRLATEKVIEKQGSFFLGPDNKSSEDLSAKPAALNTKPKTNTRGLDLSTIYPLESNIQVERPPESEHPMNRSRPFDQDLQAGVSPLNPSISSASLQPSPAKSGPPADSPTLGPVGSGTGLSGLVRQHLRSESNSSSIYGGYGGNTTSVYSTRFPIEPMENLPPSDYTSKSNPWDHNEWDDSYYTGGQEDAANENSEVSPSLSVKSPEANKVIEHRPKQSWEKDVELSQHHRDGSTATQRERRDFKNELASRRRRVQENLKSFHENDSRSASPLPTPEMPKEAASIKNNALGLLKKPSRGSLMVRTNTLGQSKAMKMLGLGNSTMASATSPGVNTTTFVEDNQWKQEEEEMLQGVQKPTTPPGTRAFRQARRDMQREKERQVAMRHQQKQETEAGESEWPNSRVENQQRGQQQIQDGGHPYSSRTRRRTPSRDRKPPPVTYRQRNGHGSQESKYSMATDRSDSRPPSSRDRSESDTSGGRSKSRNGRYRDDLAKAMAEGLSSSSQPGSEDLEVRSTRFMPRSPGNPNLMYNQSPVASPMMGPGDRSRSNSRSTAAGYFESQKFPNVQTGLSIEPGMSPRPSPSAPYVVNPTPPLHTPTGSSSDLSSTYQPAKRKISINKSDISDPIFVHSTSRVDTVNLPGGGPLRNGVYPSSTPPAIPPVNPRRRQPRNMFGMGKKSDSSDDLHSLPAATQSSEEMSTFSADEEESKPKFSRSKLRKSSSEGGNLNARARQIAYGQPSPAMPGAFPGSGSPPQEILGGMF